MRNHRIVLTGAPASGKTTCFEALKDDPIFSGFVFLDELARQLLESKPKFRFHTDEFHREIYKLQVQREKETGDKPFITDRGTLDGFTFCPDLIDSLGTTIENEYRRYSAVIQLGSTALLGDEFYQKDSIRTESIEKVVELEKATTNIWGKHPNFKLLPAERDFDEKLSKLKELINILIEQ